MKSLLTVCVSAFLLFAFSIAGAQESSSDVDPGASTAPGMGQGRGMGQGQGMGRNMPTFEEFDLDKSGYLHKEEFIQARTQRISERAKEGRMMRGLSNMMEFEDFDKDADGKITPDEFAQGIVVHRQQHMQQ